MDATFTAEILQARVDQLVVENKSLKAKLAESRVRDLEIEVADLTLALAQSQDLKRTCECSEDDQCMFARERDEARIEAKRLARAVVTSRFTSGDGEDPMPMAREILARGK